MSWDTSSSFKSLCTAYSAFQCNPTDQLAQDLQRQIDALLGMTSRGILKDFSPKDLIYTESLSVLVGLINEPNLKNSMYLKSLMALSELANDIETKRSLQTSFNLPSTLAIFIIQQSSTNNKQIVLQSINLLQKVTFDSTVVLASPYVTELTRILVKIILASNASDQALYSLYCIANLCRSDANVHAFLKTMPDVKMFYRKLFSHLSSSNKAFTIPSLLILTNLVINDEIGEKIFHGHNLNNMIHLVFNVLITKEDLVTRQYAITLIIDLSKSGRVLDVMMSNEMFGEYICRVLNLLHSTDFHTTDKILELLVVFCEKEKLRQCIAAVFLNQCQTDEETQLPNEVNLSPAQAIIQLVSSSDKTDISHSVKVKALALARDLTYEIIQTGAVKSIATFIDELVQVFPIYLTSDALKTGCEKSNKQHLQLITCVLENFINLCKCREYKQQLSSKIADIDVVQVITDIMDCYYDTFRQINFNGFENGIEVMYSVFRGLELFSSLKSERKDGKIIYSRLIQDGKLVPYLAYSLTSHSKYLVHAGIQLVTECLKSKEFQTSSLCDILLLMNQNRHNETARLKSKQIEVTPVSQTLLQGSQQIMQASQPLRDISNIQVTPIKTSSSINALSERLKKSLEVKDSKVSDIMEFYEHKLAAITGREKQLEDLLEAKTIAVMQSDRLLSQYRCRQAQADAECLKLRGMLREREKRSECDSVKMEEYLKTKNDLESKIASMGDQLKVLEAVAEEHNHLNLIFKDQSQKLESLQQSLVAAEEEHQSLVAMHTLLQENAEKLKSKLDCANKRIALMEDEQGKAREELNTKNTEITNLQKSIQLKETERLKINAECENLRKEIKNMEKDMKKLETQYNRSKNDIAKLEDHCREYEQQLKEKDDYVITLQEDLEKQKEIAAMIHNLTSGRMNMSK